MRVLFLTHRLPYAPNRGDRIRSYHIVRTLAETCEVDVVSLVHGEGEASQVTLLDGIATNVVTARIPRARNLARAAKAFASGQSLTHALLDAPDLNAKLARHVGERPPDVVLAFCSGIAPFALMPPLRDIPFVLDMVDVDSEKWARLSHTVPAVWRGIYAYEARQLSRFEAAAARQAFTTTVVNERERVSLLRLAPNADVRVVPNGIDEQHFRPPGPPASEPVVTFCGVFNYSPNEQAAVWFARSVWPLVEQRRADARLLLLGASPTAAVRRLAAREPSIQVTGRVADVRPYLWRSALAIAPLHIARGIQNKVLEALAAGLPVVVTSAVAEGLPEEVMPACRVSDSAETFADAIIELLERPGTMRREIACRAHLVALSWSRQLAPLVDALHGAVRAGRAGLGPATSEPYRPAIARRGPPAVFYTAANK